MTSEWQTNTHTNGSGLTLIKPYQADHGPILGRARARMMGPAGYTRVRMWIATTKNNTSGTGQYNYAILLIPSDCQLNLDHLEPSKVRTGSPSVSFNAWSVSCHRLRHCWVWDSEVDLGDCGLRIAACGSRRADRGLLNRPVRNTSTRTMEYGAS